jgi:DNA-binding HxlR family transcriptional regulator
MTRYDQFCAVARAAEIIGERWTLLIVRELLLGPKRYSDLKARLAPIAPGVLNGRLRALENHGVIERREVGPPTPARLFQLTEAGLALEPAMTELLKWGSRYLFPVREGERFEPEWFGMVLKTYARREPVPEVSLALELRTASQSALYRVSGGRQGTLVSTSSPSGGPVEATISAAPAPMLGLLSGRLEPGAASRQGMAVVEGNPEAAALLPQLFNMN